MSESMQVLARAAIKQAEEPVPGTPLPPKVAKLALQWQEARAGTCMPAARMRTPMKAKRAWGWAGNAINNNHASLKPGWKKDGVTGMLPVRPVTAEPLLPSQRASSRGSHGECRKVEGLVAQRSTKSCRN